jgi:hypothetical protein
MEVVLTLLVVVLLVVLPIAYFVFVIGGLLYCVYRAIMGGRGPAETRAGVKGA